MEEIKMKFTFLLLTIIALSINDLNAQGWRFPSCDDMTVTKIETAPDNSDQLLITVYSDCDTCRMHVYLGLRVFHNQDTLAVEIGMYSKPSPDNNSDYQYHLQKNKDFEFSDITRIEMDQLCDSLSISQSVLSSDRVDDSKIEIFPNPTGDWLTLEFAEDIKIENLKIINSQGRLMLERKNEVTKLDLGSFASGIYFLEFKTNKGVFTKKILKD